MRFRLTAAAALLLLAAAVRAQEVDEPEAAPAPHAAAISERDLQPYFTGAAKKAADLLAAGKAAQALALLPAKAKDVPGRWLRALAQKGAGKCAAARPDFEALAAKGGPLRDRALFLAGLCAGELGDGEGAAELFKQVSQGSIDAGEAYLEAARYVAKLHPAKEAAPLVEEVLVPLLAASVRGDPAAAHLVSGDAFAAAGDKKRALSHWQTAWLDFPLSGAAQSARDKARRLAPLATAEPGRVVRRIEMLVDGGRFKQAVAEAAALKLPKLCAGGCPGDRTPASLIKAAIEALNPGVLPAQHQPTPADVARAPKDPADPLSCRAKLAQGRAYKKLHQSAQSRAVLAPVVLRCGDPEVRSRALFVLAQIQAGKPEADALWLALAGNFPQSSLADDALYAAALARSRAGDAAGARGLLERLVAEHADSDTAGEALFQLFWSDWAAGHPRSGLPWLELLAKKPDPDGADEERARYWRARALLEPQAGDTAEATEKAAQSARDDLLWLARERPLTYHGLLARSRLAELATDMESKLEEAEAARVSRLAQIKPRPLHLGPLAGDVHLLAAIEYLRLAQPKDAARELSAISRKSARAAGEAGHEVMTLIADLYVRSGDLRSAHNVIRTDLRALLRHPASILAVRAALLAYPLAFRPAIDKVAITAAIPADLLQALMREESALDPRAVSSAGALGLTQLMPRTAREVAKRLKIGRFIPAMLFEPAVNIRIGGTYFGQLYSHFKNPALALASYNAGPGNVSSWIRAHGELPLDAFVEQIPLDETRGYVKRCLRSFAAYRYLYGRGPARVPHVGQQVAAN